MNPASLNGFSIRNRQRPIQLLDREIQVFLLHNQRRRNHEVAHPRLLATPCAIILAAI